jgi:hypothetical protein
VQCFADNVAKNIALQMAHHHANKIGNFLQRLIDESILTKSSRIVRRKTIVDFVKTGKSQYSSFELVSKSLENLKLLG